MYLPIFAIGSHVFLACLKLAMKLRMTLNLPLPSRVQPHPVLYAASDGHPVLYAPTDGT